MEIAEVQNRFSLERYLDGLPKGERREVAVRVAFRAAARVLPIAALDFATNQDLLRRDLTAAPIFGFVAIASVAAVSPTGAIAPDASASAAYATAASAYAADAASSAYTANTYAASASAYAAADAAASAYAADAAAYAVDATAADVWDVVRLDLTEGDNGPLWRDGAMPDLLVQAWTDAKTAMGKDTKADWSFWIAWYERVLAGRDFLPSDMAPILNKLRKEDWKKGPAHINPLFDGVLAKYRAQDIEVSSSAHVHLTSGTPQTIERTRVAMVAHRKSLPTTFDAILGFVTLEIERLQGLNYQNDDARDEALRQIRVLTTIYETVGRLMPLVPTTDAMSLVDAEKAEGLVQIYVTQIQEWPRNNAQELVDSTYRLALIGCVAAAAPMVGISASIAAVAGGAMFGGKKLIDSAKAAKDALGAGG